MQDPRLRLLAALVLSLSCLISTAGALLALAWLALYPKYLKAALKSRAFYLLLSLPGVVALALQYGGGDGLSYFTRMGALILLGLAMFRGWVPGEFLDLSVWLLGSGVGFDAGLAAELALQGMDDASRDWSRVLTALKMKGLWPGIRSIAPAGALLIHLQLIRARDQADLLTARGYRAGGSCCPEFHTSNRDIFALFCAIVVLFVSLIPVREIFILGV